jgi:hypothetical protein
MSTDYPHLDPDQPWISITVADDGQLSVKMFGVDRDIPAHLQHRDRMGHLFDYLYDLFAQPFAAEIIEADGHVDRGIVDQREKPRRGLHEWADEDEPNAAEASEVTQSPVDPSWGPPEGQPLPVNDLPLAPGPASPGTPGDDNNVSVYVEGFTPGEEACIAFIVAGAMADSPNGLVSFQIPRNVLASLPTGEIIVFGRSSGTTTVRKPLTDQ